MCLYVVCRKVSLAFDNLTTLAVEKSLAAVVSFVVVRATKFKESVCVYTRTIQHNTGYPDIG